MCALRSDAFHAFQGITHEQQGALVVKQKTRHDERRHQCCTPLIESMLTEAESYVQHLSMAISLAKCCENCQNNSPHRLRQNKQTTIFQHCRHAAIDQRAFMYTTASTSFHRDSVSYAPNNTHRRPSTTNDTRPRKNKHTHTHKPTGNGWSGRTEIIGTILYVCAFFRKKSAYFHLTGSNHTGHPVCPHCRPWQVETTVSKSTRCACSNVTGCRSRWTRYL